MDIDKAARLTVERALARVPAQRRVRRAGRSACPMYANVHSSGALMGTVWRCSMVYSLLALTQSNV
jgi:hypothetical protein